MKTITQVIFDNDGLLLDTEGLYSEILQKILDDYGKKFTNEVKFKQMGRPTKEAAQVLIDYFNIPMTVEEYVNKLSILRPQYFPSARLMPGTERLIKHLHKNNIPIAVATSSDKISFNLKITNHKELFSKFDHIVNGCDVEIKKGKPAPDIYLLASKRFKEKVNFENVLVFEDSLSGVQAGLAAGMHVVWVVDARYCPFSQEQIDEYKCAQLTIINNLNDFEPTLFNLPSY